MRRIAAIALTIGALLALAGCQTDNSPPVVAGPPPQPAALNEPANAATIAWAAQMVGAALAAEKSARDAGKTEADVTAAIDQTLADEGEAYATTGASPAQFFAGAHLAQADPRNTPATARAFQNFDFGAFVASPVGAGSGHCTGCKGVH